MKELLLNPSENQKILSFPFFKDDLQLKNAPFASMSLKAAGSMRFRWNEVNPNRDAFLNDLCSYENGNYSSVSVELIHSKIVYDVKSASDTKNLSGDGMITVNRKLIPVVTVADCMPIFLYDSSNGVFGVVHSGWKGTGIIGEAVKLAGKNYGSSPENISVILGPHIRDCCYIVNEERAEYFINNFCKECVSPLEEGGGCYCGGKGLKIHWDNGEGRLYRLSLEKANLSVLKKTGIPDGNICVIKDCTCCNPAFGSNRRQTAEGKSFSVQAAEGKSFTVQAAFITNRT